MQSLNIGLVSCNHTSVSVIERKCNPRVRNYPIQIFHFTDKETEAPKGRVTCSCHN